MGKALSTCGCGGCGGRVEKAIDDDVGDYHILKTIVSDVPAGGKLNDTIKPKASLQAQKKGRVFKKIGKVCCCSNLGDKVQKESQAPKPQPFPSDLDEPEGEPGSSKAVELACARKNGERQDLNGKWLLTQFEGDMEKLCIECGMGWVKRTAAQAVNYGKGSVQLHTKQDGDSIKVEKKLTTGFWVTQEGTVGCQAQAADDLGVLQATPEYDSEGALTFECMNLANEYRFTLKRIRHSPEELHEIVTDPSGLLIKQVYTLMDDEGKPGFGTGG